MDVLSDILSTLRLRGTVYFEADFRAPWGMDMKGGAVANFHLVVEGCCWLRGPGDLGLRTLHKGDLVVLPHGDRHALLHAPDAEAKPAEAVVDLGCDSSRARPQYGGDGDATTLICGHFAYERAGMHPLIEALPSVIHLASDQQKWIMAASRLTALESSSQEDGSGAVVDRLAEVLLIQVIRAHARNLDDQRGFLAALAEPTLAKALSVLHNEPAKQWHLETVARECGVSRTILVDRFNDILGTAPMRYLKEWRMHKARELFVTSELSVAEVAQQVGYASEWSLSKAYKHMFGEGPGATRRSAALSKDIRVQTS